MHLLAYCNGTSAMTRDDRLQAHAPAGDDTVCQEECPDSVPPVTILGYHFLLVLNPVLVPPVDRRGVMDTEDINVLDLETSTFQL